MPEAQSTDDSKTDAAAAGKSAYGETWFAATMVEAPPRPPLTVDLDIDVCVIGGGLAGLTAAREIARSGWSVVLIEADRIAAKASGRNTGFVLPGFAAGPDSIIGRVGFERARDLWTLSQSGVDYVRGTVDADAIAGIDRQDGWLHVSKTDNGDAFTRLAGLVGDFGGDIEGWPTERARAVLRSERYFHALHFPQAICIHPLNYALGLAAAAERAGARIFEYTPAVSIDPAGVRKRIVTPLARLRATHVVLCGNVGMAQLAPHIAGALIPITTYVITTAPLGAALDEAIGFRGAVTDTDLADNHYRIVGGDRLMLSGRLTTWARNPRRYARALARDVAKTYPQLGSIAVDYAWSGTVGYPIHGMPQIGELAPGVWLASGFGGHGLNTTALAGNLIARAIIDGDDTWKRFTPFELVWAGGLFGRGITQIYYWASRLTAALAERRARAAAIGRSRAGSPAPDAATSSVATSSAATSSAATSSAATSSAAPSSAAPSSTAEATRGEENTDSIVPSPAQAEVAAPADEPAK
jgi:glycine/D-amino acid oxidase-like deaminating enzyme